MARNPYFDAVLKRMQEVHDKKNEDYADNDNPYSNFENTATMTGLKVSQVFHVMISIKVERLRQLATGKAPNYESLNDNLLDLANYATLWLSYEDRRSDNMLPGERKGYENLQTLSDALNMINTPEQSGERPVSGEPGSVLFQRLGESDYEFFLRAERRKRGHFKGDGCYERDFPMYGTHTPKPPEEPPLGYDPEDEPSDYTELSPGGTP